MNDGSNDPGPDRPIQQHPVVAALLALPMTVVMPFVVFFRQLQGIWSDPASRAILITAGLLLVAGTFLFMIIEGFSPLDSLYFCFITLATIGYGDFSPVTDLGKIVTMVYGLAGLGIVAALISTIGSQHLRSRGSSDRKDAGA